MAFLRADSAARLVSTKFTPREAKQRHADEERMSNDISAVAITYWRDGY
ncbi:hypothetical protein [Roseovarius aestuariivivens]|nr:hypothetical protein [Roseovarius aestuariivivens]